MALTKEDLQAIGELLAPIQADLQGLKAGVNGLRTDVNRLETDVCGLKTDMSEVKDRVTRIEITQENIIVPNIQLLAEGPGGLVSRLDRLEELPEQIEDIQSSVSALKHVFKGHVHS